MFSTSRILYNELNSAAYDPEDRNNLVGEREMDTVDCGFEGNPDIRVILINRPQPNKFCTNHIHTAKYSVVSFVPSFLFEQFRRYANCFFLFVALMQQIPDVSPTGRYTTLVPLIFILLVSALKEIVEDYKRHRADDEINHREVEVLRAGNWQWVEWRHVVVGDIVKVHNNNFFPADLLVLSSSEPQAMCYIETMNLDGETNLKIRQGLPETAKLLETKDLELFRGRVECELPNRHLYDFSGNLKEGEKQAVPLGPDRILLRGAMLRNTSWIFGLVIYTGHETKLMKNSTSAPLKRSTVDKQTNTQVLMLFILLIVLCLLSAIFNELWNRSHTEHTYIGLADVVSVNFGYNLLTFIILYNNLIPISLQVTLEVVRFVQATFINMDLDMYHEESDTPAMARTSNLNEELGMVKYIFSDKTGTLTRNVMEFKECSIGEHLYSLPATADLDDSLLIQHLKRNDKLSQTIRDFMVLMSVCHTVIPEKQPDNNDIIYHASSPDERALLQGAKAFGFVFDTRTPDSVEIVALGSREKYEILSVIEFTSARKRMSVIVRTPEGKIKLFCKGADTVIYERLSANGRAFADTTLKHLEEFAQSGLRTLCFASVDLSERSYKEWRELYMKACTSIQNRETKIEDAANMIEKDLILLGATAVEDKLQEQVPETIAALMKADINVWVLTGDKQETAINIGYSSKLISHGTPLIILNETSLDGLREVIHRHCSELGEALGKTNNNLCLVVDGASLKFALTHELRREFLQLCISCKSVICCRVSPMQKAEVVDLVTSNTDSVTLAIGDGANDVAMIQKAHVGIGISGVEGLQAACASDYSIAQFRFLLKLLFVHGSWNYHRLCELILYSFYKNICLYVMELWFAIYSGWSGQILFERWTIGLYNVLFTAAPPLAMGILDQLCSANTMLRYPKLYAHRSFHFDVGVFWVWIVNALFHSVLLFWLPMYAVKNDIIWKNGKEGGYLVLGNMVYTYVVVAVCVKAGLHMKYWTWLTHLAIWGSIGAWFLLIIAYSRFWPTIPLGQVMAGMDRMIFTSPVFWFGLILIPLAVVLIDISVIALICQCERVAGVYLNVWWKKLGSEDVVSTSAPTLLPDSSTPPTTKLAASSSGKSEHAELTPFSSSTATISPAVSERPELTPHSSSTAASSPGVSERPELTPNSSSTSASIPFVLTLSPLSLFGTPNKTNKSD
ncbi:probable phospholipid-transporting ATPase IA isoform X3 [Macrosteles quadrilineatus]|uniref:probable phospholipid-transporting ATPase IA isoform X3 n=1 Tax=Macrosteles quadrilineatus TaxID=74068 RepID=UPI0023E29116|nr:probable phospholipid-transporting ATPase IA isoform X3 [Macrosteles quadrilineatus]